MKKIWFYELPLPEGRKNYSKTKPLEYEEFGDCLPWWDNGLLEAKYPSHPNHPHQAYKKK
jgi:hypothetical protein